jgi:glycosyltransferase involved in cell wall biosynthesis
VRHLQLIASHNCWLAAVDASQFLPGDGRQPAGRVTVVALSRLTYRKGVDLLNVVVPAVCRRHPHVDFIIGELAPDAYLLTLLGVSHLLRLRSDWMWVPARVIDRCNLAEAQHPSCRSSSRSGRTGCTAGGDGPMAGMLRDTIQREGLSSRVTMLGAVPTQAVRDVLVSDCQTSVA